MYALVNDVESYPEFLPWCSEARVHASDDHHLRASLSMQASKLKYTFMTENTMQENEVINVRLVEGPFKQLTGSWQFEDRENGACFIKLQMQFEFKNRIVKMALDKTFNRIVNSLVEAFHQRARQLYG